MPTRWQRGSYNDQDPPGPTRVCVQTIGDDSGKGYRWPSWCVYSASYRPIDSRVPTQADWTFPRNNRCDTTHADPECVTELAAVEMPPLLFDSDPSLIFFGLVWACDTSYPEVDPWSSGQIGGPLSCVFGSNHAVPIKESPGIGIVCEILAFAFEYDGSGYLDEVNALKLKLDIHTIDPSTDTLWTDGIVGYGDVGTAGPHGSLICGTQFYLFVEQVEVTSTFKFVQARAESLESYGLYTYVEGELEIDLTEEIESDTLFVYVVPYEFYHLEDTPNPYLTMMGQLNPTCEEVGPLIHECYYRTPSPPFSCINTFKFEYE